jgi:hypothetical protein
MNESEGVTTVARTITQVVTRHSTDDGGDSQVTSCTHHKPETQRYQRSPVYVGYILNSLLFKGYYWLHG